MRARSTDRREQRVARQIELILAQEDALDVRREHLREREERLQRRERHFEQRRREIEAIWAEHTAELEERERLVREGERTIERRLLALEQTVRKKARAFARERVALSEPAWGGTVHELPGQAVQADAPRLDPPASVGEDTVELGPPAPAAAERWNLNGLTRLVEEHAAANPGRAEKWRYYLLYLRGFAEPDGALPNSFDWLVRDAFGELIRSEPTSAAA